MGLRTARLFRLFFSATTRFRYGLGSFFRLFFNGLAVQVRRFRVAICRTTGYGNVALVRVSSRTRVIVGYVAVLFLARFAGGLYRVVASGAMVVNGVLQPRLQGLPPQGVAIRAIGGYHVYSRFQ